MGLAGEHGGESNAREGGGSGQMVQSLRELPTGSRKGSDVIIRLHVLVLLFLKEYCDGGGNKIYLG